MTVAQPRGQNGSLSRSRDRKPFVWRFFFTHTPPPLHSPGGFFYSRNERTERVLRQLKVESFTVEVSRENYCRSPRYSHAFSCVRKALCVETFANKFKFIRPFRICAQYGKATTSGCRCWLHFRYFYFYFLSRNKTNSCTHIHLTSENELNINKHIPI